MSLVPSTRLATPIQNQWPRFCLSWWLIILGWGVITPSHSLGQNQIKSSTAAAPPGVRILMLKNGNSFQGTVSRDSHRHSIETHTGNILLIANDQIDFIADSIEEAYWMRLAKISATDLESHESLFYWCVKHRLLILAQNQIDVLHALDYPANQRLALQTQLDTLQFAQHQSLSQHQRSQNHDSPNSTLRHSEGLSNVNEIQAQRIRSIDTGSATMAESDSLDKLGSYFDFGINPQITSLPPLDKSFTSPEVNSIAQVVYESPVEENTVPFLPTVMPTEGHQSTETSISRQGSTELLSSELGKWVKGLAPGSFLDFRQSIEPLLIANCGKCHHHDASEPIHFRLIFAGYRQPRSHLMSQRNLYRVWSALDRDLDPLNSKSLIDFALTAHGDMTEAPIKKESSEHMRLAEWIHLVTTGDDLENSVPAPVVSQTSSIHPIASLERSTTNPNMGNLKEIPKLGLGAGQYQPQDEFDAEIFNRGLHRRKYRR